MELSNSGLSEPGFEVLDPGLELFYQWRSGARIHVEVVAYTAGGGGGEGAESKTDEEKELHGWGVMHSLASVSFLLGIAHFSIVKLLMICPENPGPITK